MTRDDMKTDAADRGLEPAAVLSLYDSVRRDDMAEFNRRKAVRQDIAARFGARFGGNVGRVKLAIGVHGAGDHASVPGFDEVAQEVATLYPEVCGGSDPTGELWAFLQADDSAPTVAESWARTVALAELQGLRPKAKPVSPDDLLPMAEVAAMADITPQWALKMAKSGKLSAVNIGGRWFALRSAAEAYRRTNEGRPRRAREEFSVF